jgi:hypothetical protein
MKLKLFALVQILLLGIIFQTNVTYSQPDKKPVNPGKTPEEMASQMSDMLKRDLTLSDEQYKQVYDILLNYHTTHTESTFDMDELNSQIENVLTKEQLEKFEKIKEEKERINKKKSEPPEGPPQGKHPRGKPPQGEPPGKF